MGEKVEEKKMDFPPLFETFRSVGWMNGATPKELEIEEKHQSLIIIAVKEEMLEEDDCPWIH
ncbi:hypothetical protein COLO4_20650 [Corchorus olitorius]|uniref:Uncharacterized protein n=1 Tax=Corchorus olitorius TaxID=93759 RepID=A0A1R3IY28_9ROSI|nr:hypothetical protein COLO4_20650 [Corchorus olitorius]